MFATVRRYNVKAGKMPETIARVKKGLMPLLTKQQGFHAYHALDAGHNVAVSISFYQSRAAADAANKHAAAWVKENLAELITPVDVEVGEVLAEATVAHA